MKVIPIKTFVSQTIIVTILVAKEATELDNISIEIKDIKISMKTSQLPITFVRYMQILIRISI